MNNHNGKKISFFGTIFFHIILLCCCYFFTIGSTTYKKPSGIVIQFLPNEESFLEKEEKNMQLNNHSKNINIESKKKEELITDNIHHVMIPVQKDTLNTSKIKNKKPTISSQLSDAILLWQTTESAESDIENLDNKTIPPSKADTIGNNSTDFDGYVLTENRHAIDKVKPNYICQEFGTVIVKVKVNHEGKTIWADPGFKGTTESSSCLWEEAKGAALKTTWTPDFESTEDKIGYITYNFHRTQ